MRYLTRIIVGITCTTFLLTSCDDDKKKPTEDLPAARPLLEESADEIQNASSLDVEIDVEGYPVALAANNLENMPVDVPLYFKYAKGVFQAPDRLEATIQFSLNAFNANADLIALDREHYFRSDLLTANRWIKAELIPGFSPVSLLARPGGIAYALLSITNLEMVGREDMDGLNVFHLRGTVLADAMSSLTFGLIRTQEGDLKIEVFIGVGDHRVALIRLLEPPPTEAVDSEDTTWLINILDYNREVSITPPPMDENNE